MAVDFNNPTISPPDRQLRLGNWRAANVAARDLCDCIARADTPDAVDNAAAKLIERLQQAWTNEPGGTE